MDARHVPHPMPTTTPAPSPRRAAADRPGLSVALCTWNGARWLGPMLASLADQERLPDEVVVQDDCSDDDTVAIIEAFAATAPFPVHLEVNHERVGSTRNFAQALDRCEGRVIALADQDDIWYREKLARLLEEFDADPTVTMVFSDADLMFEDGRLTGRRLWPTRLVDRTLRHHAVVPEELFARRALTTGCTMAIRRRVVEAALPFPASLDDPHSPMRHDRWLSLVAAAVGTVRAFPEPLIGFRIHPDQQTGVLIGSALPRALLRAAAIVVSGRDDHADATHRVRASQLSSAAERAEDLGDFAQAATLRTIAEHEQARVLGAVPPSQRIAHVLRTIGSGGYPIDARGLTAAGADLIRAARRSRSA